MGKYLDAVMEVIADANKVAESIPATVQDEAFRNPKIQAIVQILHLEPLLVQPTLNFINAKRQQLARAQLITLYGEDEYNRMVAEATK